MLISRSHWGQYDDPNAGYAGMPQDYSVPQDSTRWMSPLHDIKYTEVKPSLTFVVAGPNAG